MTDNNLTLSREQVGEIVRALSGVGNLVTNVASKPGNAFELYAIMSNIAVIQAILTGTSRASSNWHDSVRSVPYRDLGRTRWRDDDPNVIAATCAAPRALRKPNDGRIVHAEIPIGIYEQGRVVRERFASAKKYWRRPEQSYEQPATTSTSPRVIGGSRQDDSLIDELCLPA